MLLVDNDPFNPERVVSEEEAADFELDWQRQRPHSTFQSCDTDNFRLFFHHTPRCGWNESAAEVFARDFVRALQISEERLPDIRERFLTRVRTLQRDFKKYQLPDEQQWEAEKGNCRRGRRTTTFERRLFVVENHPNLKGFTKEMEYLGGDAMSDDESDTEDVNIVIRVNGKRRPGRRSFTYHVNKPRWRSSTLSSILHSLDTLYPVVKSMLGYAWLVLERNSTGNQHASIRKC
ncbi:hypothetical protein BJ165DRAFT_1409367 [Panaeolus papilionaceus]|nr:hypothetical protein BJ165DRAFT_1409367 [Panaeolus papilionaceus]